MTAADRPLVTWDAPKATEVGDTVDAFLLRLGGPAWITIPGRDASRTRAISTLLHGNEPSGIRAVHQWLRAGERPAVNLVCLIAAVDAALAPPGFGHRCLPGRPDLNRCFREPFEGFEGALAAEALRRLRAVKPESLIDVHNTSGSGPAYAVSSRHSPAHEALTALFSRYLIETDLRLGTLMEATEDDFPTVTVECGGGRDPLSDQVAAEGLRRYATAETIFPPTEPSPGITVLKHPMRVELREGARVAYAPAPAGGADITFPPDVDRFNFGVVGRGQTLGWLGARGLAALTARDASGEDHVDRLFTADDGRLIVARPARFFMITTDPGIARSDCLFYVIPA